MGIHNDLGTKYFTNTVHCHYLGRCAHRRHAPALQHGDAIAVHTGKVQIVGHGDDCQPGLHT
jgi:hypothetical protein